MATYEVTTESGAKYQIETEQGSAQPSNESPYQTGNPLTSPVVPYKKPEGYLGKATFGLKTLLNVPTSTARNVSQLGSAIGNVFNPNMEKNTLAGISRTAAGAVQSIPGVRGVYDKYSTPKGKETLASNRQAFDNLKTFFGQRYGSVENIKRTIQEDPTGFAFDVATALEGGGSAITRTGAVGTGQRVSALGEAINPVRVGTQATGATVGSMLDRGLAPFRKSADTAAIKAGEELGVKLPISAMTKSRFVQGLEAVQSKGLFGFDLQKTFTEAVEATKEKLNNVVESVKPKNALNTQKSGMSIQEGFKEYVDKFDKTKDAIYNGFMGKFKDTPAVISNTETALNDVISQKKLVPGGTSDVGFFQTKLDALIGKEIAQLRKQGVSQKMIDAISAKLPKPQLTLENLKAFRTQVGEMLKNQNDPIATGNRASLGKLYGALTDDIESTIGSVSPEAGKQFQKINNFYKEGIAKINSQMGRSIEKMPPEQIVGKYIKPNNVTALTDLKEVAGKEAFQNVSNTFLVDTIKKSVNKLGEFDPIKFKNNIAKFDDPTLRALLNDEQYTRLQTALSDMNKIGTVIDPLKKGGAMGAGSQTAFLSNVSRVKEMLIGGGAVASIYSPKAALGIIAYLVGDKALTRFMETSAGRKYFTTGFPGLGDKAKKAIQSVGKSGTARNLPTFSNYLNK